MFILIGIVFVIWLVYRVLMAGWAISKLADLIIKQQESIVKIAKAVDSTNSSLDTLWAKAFPRS
jgi:hypothetical protein